MNGTGWTNQDAAALGRLTLATERIAEQQRDFLAAFASSVSDLGPALGQLPALLDWWMQRKNADGVALRDIADALLEAAVSTPAEPEPVDEGCGEGEHEWQLTVPRAFGDRAELRCKHCPAARDANDGEPEPERPALQPVWKGAPDVGTHA